MDDYLSEKEQWEVLKSWIKENGLWIIGGIGLGALGVAGWNWWQGERSAQALEAGAKYEQILEAFDRGDRTRALTLIGKLERDHSRSPYLDQAHLAEARVAVQSGQLDRAAASLQRVVENTRDDELALIARLRLARVQMAQNKPNDALATLDAVKDPGAFAPRYHEARGDLYHAKGDKAAALKEYQAARAGGATQAVDTELLDLKINDLTGGAPAAALSSTSAPPAEVE